MVVPRSTRWFRELSAGGRQIRPKTSTQLDVITVYMKFLLGLSASLCINPAALRGIQEPKTFYSNRLTPPRAEIRYSMYTSFYAEVRQIANRIKDLRSLVSLAMSLNRCHHAQCRMRTDFESPLSVPGVND